MFVEIGLIIFRLWAWGIVIFCINAISRFVFKPALSRILSTISALAYSLIWPLALCSPEGRNVLLNRIEQL